MLISFTIIRNYFIIRKIFFYIITHYYILSIFLCILIIHACTLWPTTLQYYMYRWLTLKGSKTVKERELPEGSRMNGRDTAFTSEADSNSVLK